MSSDDLRAVVDRLLEGLRAPVENSLRVHTDDIHRQNDTERAAAVRQAAETAFADARGQAEAEMAELRASAQREIDEIRRSAQEQVESLEARLRSSDAARETERQNSQAELASARRDAEEALAAARSRADADIEDARRTAQAQVEDVQRVLDQRLAEANTRVGEGQRALEESRRVAEETRVRTEELRRQLLAAQAEMDELSKRSAAEAQALVAAQVTAAAEAHQRRLMEGITRARSESREAAVTQTRELLQGIRSLDEAQSLGDALGRLAEVARRGSERVAVLIVKGDRLREWRTAGFSGTGSSERIEVDMHEGGVAAEAARTGRGAVQIAADVQALPAFARGGEARAAAALPISVGGTVVGVLYVDTLGADASRDTRWPATFEVLARHASRVLEAIAVQRAAALLPVRGARAAAPHLGNLG